MSAMALLTAVLLIAASLSAPNSLGQRFVQVPAGRYPMGSADSLTALQRDFPAYATERLQALRDEAPAHSVRLRAFEIAETEVTRGQFREFLRESGRAPDSAGSGGGYGYDPQHKGPDTFAGRDPRYDWAHTGFPQDDRHPVVNVSWHDAQAFAAWLSAREGRRYRLPTEAEWEVACRAGRTSRWPQGDAPRVLQGQANLFDAAARPLWSQWSSFAMPWDDGQVFTAPVASFAANPWGLHDMVGNVWEWVQDWYEAYPDQALRDNPRGPDDGSVKVRRGGSWHSWALYSRCSYRNWNSPESRYVLLGFRLVRELEAK